VSLSLRLGEERWRFGRAKEGTTGSEGEGVDARKNVIEQKKRKGTIDVVAQNQWRQERDFGTQNGEAFLVEIG